MKVIKIEKKGKYRDTLEKYYIYIKLSPQQASEAYRVMGC
jgi:hypothetical protein